MQCRGAQISQVLLNLLSNAYDAVEHAAVRRVRVGARGDDSAVRITVTDTGPGIPPDIAPRIMEPFFTTKEVGKGTGLGLAASKGIAEGHRGTLTYERADGETRFVLTLPRSVPREQVHQPANRTGSLMARGRPRHSPSTGARMRFIRRTALFLVLAAGLGGSGCNLDQSGLTPAGSGGTRGGVAGGSGAGTDGIGWQRGRDRGRRNGHRFHPGHRRNR